MEEGSGKSYLDPDMSIGKNSVEPENAVQADCEPAFGQAEIKALFESTRAALQYRKFEDVARIICNNCIRITGASGSYVAMRSSDGEQDVLFYLKPGGLRGIVNPTYHMPVQGLMAEAYQAGTGIFRNDLKNIETTEIIPGGKAGAENILLSPLMIRGSADGMFCLLDKEGGFTEADVQVTAALADIAVIAYNNIRADRELQESENRYKTLVESVTDYIYTVDIHDGLPASTKHGPGCLAVTGYSPAEFESDPYLWYRIILEEDRASTLRKIESIMSERDRLPLEHRIVRKDGSIRWVKNTVVMRYDDIGHIVAYDGLISDITERKKAEEALLRTNKALKTISRCNERLVRAHSEPELLSDICEIIVTEGRYRLAWVGTAEQDEGKTVRPLRQFGRDKGYFDAVRISWADNEFGQGPEGACIRSGKPSVMNDILNTPTNTPWREEAVKRGYLSIMALPLHTEHEIFGCLTICASEADAFDEAEIKMLAELADDLAFGIASFRMTKAKCLAEERIKAQVGRLQKLAAISVAMSGEPAEVFDTIVTSVAELLDVPVACLARVHGDRLHFLSTFVRGALVSGVADCLLDDAPCTFSKRREEVRVCHDVSRKFPDAEFLRLHNAYSYCGFQVHDDEGRVVALTCVMDDRHRDFSDEDKYLFQIFGQRIAAEIERHDHLVERRRIEKFLRESESRYRTLFERANDAIFIISAEGADAGMIVAANRAAADMHGYSIDELMTMCITELCTSESMQKKGRDVMQTCLEGRLVKEELYHRKKDGVVFPIELSAGLLELQGYRFILAVEMDITERKKSEDERERLISELQDALIRVSRSKKEWQDTFDSITDHISIISRDFSVVRANRSFAEGCGLDPKEVAGNKCHAIVHCCDAPLEDCPHSLTLNEMKPVTKEVFDPKTKGLFRISTYPYFSPDGELMGSIHISRDITREKEREIKMRRSERLASLGQLSAGMAHEIRNPINFIMANAELLGRIWEDVLKILKRRCEEEGDFLIGGFSFSANHERITKLFSGIEEGSHRIKNIVANLKVFTRAKTTDTEGPVRINGVIGATLMILENQIRSHTDNFVVDVEEDLPVVHGNSHNLEQVISNLVVNSLQSLPSRACGITLSARLDKNQNGIVLQVRDEGIGMIGDVMEKACEPFFTTKGGSGGVGLGLSICRSIIEDHGGSLRFESKPNEGTTATVVLPLTTAVGGQQ